MRIQSNPFAVAQSEPTAKPNEAEQTKAEPSAEQTKAEPTPEQTKAEPTPEEVIRQYEAESGEQASDFVKEFIGRLHDETGGKNEK